MRQFCMFGCWKAEAGLWEQRLSQIPQVQDESCLANCEDWKKADFNRINSWGWEVQACLFRHSECGELNKDILSHITICLLSYPAFQQLALIPWGTKPLTNILYLWLFSHKREHLCLSSIFYTHSIVYIIQVMYDISQFDRFYSALSAIFWSSRTLLLYNALLTIKCVHICTRGAVGCTSASAQLLFKST